MDDNIFEEIKAFTSEKLGIDKEILNRGTMIQNDCGIAGLDSMTFYDEFFKKFNIQLPNGFSYNKHVESENLEPIKTLKRLFSKRYRNQTRKIDLTLGDLEQAAINGFWIEE